MTSKEWKKVKVENICLKVCSGGTPKSTVAEYYNGDIPWLNTKEINFNRIYNTERKITNTGFKNSSAKWIDINSIIVAMYGATAGKLAIAKIPITTNQACCNLTIDNAKADYNFVYYALMQNYKVLLAMANGGAQQNLNAQQIKDFEIELPPLKIQEKIACILSSLDDKIELNNKINQNLEQQAQAIFDKYIKTPCNYLKTGTIGDYCSVKSGFAFKSSWWKDSGVKVIKIKTIDNENINFAECSFVDKEKISIAEDFIVQGGDLLIAMTGATIGKFAIVPKIDEVLLVNQRVGKFFLGTHPIKKLPFLYCTLKQQDIINDIINKGQGSAQPNISSTDILNTSCYILENAELEKFNLTCEPIFEKIITNKCENEKLKQLRDTLLPKLMSGEIDVDKAEV